MSQVEGNVEDRGKRHRLRETLTETSQMEGTSRIEGNVTVGAKPPRGKKKKFVDKSDSGMRGSYRCWELMNKVEGDE